jgi:predicted peroxiredoxin
MKNLWVAGVTLGELAQTDTQPKLRDGVNIRISQGTDYPHRVLMALRIAEVVSGVHDVLVYLDIKGNELALEDKPDIQLEEFSSSKIQLQRLAEEKVTLMACPSCLKATGKLPSDLVPEVKIADKDLFFTCAKGRILTRVLCTPLLTCSVF